ncbi:MAG: AsmA-like C-terminal region-containing protein [Balneolales bacterium]
MRIILWILGIVVGVFLIALIALNIYFTNERLQNLIVPQLQETAGREITIEEMSFSFFRTFPNFGLVADNILVPDDQGGTLATLQQMVLSLNIFPYFTNNEIRISRLDLDQPEMMYIVFEDGRTNLDELLAHMATEEDTTEAEPMDFDLRHMFINNARITYDDRMSGNQVMLGGLDSQISLRFAERLETSMSADIRNLTYLAQEEELISDMQLSFETAGGLDFDDEILTIDSGNLNISGLALTLSGTVSQWSAENMLVDLIFASDSDDFASLLDMAPETYDDQLTGVETNGNLSIAGTISGEAGPDIIPAFQFVFSVEDGYLKYPDVDDPIHSINMNIEATNDFINIQSLGALAGDNHVSAFGEIRQPLEDNARFAINLAMDVDLASVRNFYPLEEGMELSGMLNMESVAEGLINEITQATFDAEIKLQDGFVKMEDVNEPIHDINIAMLLSQERADIQSFSARAAGNALDLSGIIEQPFIEDQTGFNLNANLDLDLATIKDFYPIDEDTLMLRGKLTASGSAQGRLSDAQNAATDFQLVLANGYIHHQSIAHPIEDLSFESTVNNNYVDIHNVSLKSSNNSLTASGRINNYLSDNISVDIQADSEFDLAQAEEYYPMEDGYDLSGMVQTNLKVTGPINYMEDLILLGNVSLREVNVAGEELMQPITNLNATLNFSENQADLENFTMYMGESDFSLQATLLNYMALTYEAGEVEPAVLTGTYHSQHLNMDELYDAEAEEEPFPIELPNLVTELTATIDTITFMGMNASNISGRAETDPMTISMPEGSMDIFGGNISGAFVWNIPDPEHTNITFQGSLNNLRVESFFEEFQLGGALRLHEFANGNFNAETEYYTELDVFLNPIIPTTEATGNFGMDEAELQNHPIQTALSSLLRADDIRDLSLDEWTANYNISESILSLDNFNITSLDMGLTLEGTHNLETDELNFNGQLRMPERFADNLGRLITSQGAEALKDEDGLLTIPLQIGGTSENPQPTLDNGKIEDVLSDYLRSRAQDEGRDAVQGILNRFRDN